MQNRNNPYITNVNLKVVKQNLKLNPYMNYFERKL